MDVKIEQMDVFLLLCLLFFRQRESLGVLVQVLIDFLLMLQDRLKERELQLTHRDSGIAQRKVDFSTASLTGVTYIYVI